MNAAIKERNELKSVLEKRKTVCDIIEENRNGALLLKWSDDGNHVSCTWWPQYAFMIDFNLGWESRLYAEYPGKREVLEWVRTMAKYHYAEMKRILAY